MAIGKDKIMFGIGLDNKQLQADALKSKQILGGITDKAIAEGQKMDNQWRTLSRTVGLVFSTGVLAKFVEKMATVRGEFQQLEVAFTTMLGSKERADRLMKETIEFAAKTPFDLQGVAKGTKQLLAYGSQAETVTDELAMLGNIASGLSIPLNDIVYLYGTTRTQGRLFTMDLRQFMGRGIPLAKELAKQFGVTEQRVAGLVTEGKVGFKDVEKAMQSMTAEGGMFFNLMEEQSKTITGKMSNLGDGISQMFNKIGESNQDAMSEGLDMTIDLVENYEKVGKSIAELIALYGTYRASLIVTTVVQNLATQSMKGWTFAQMAGYRWAMLLEKAQKAVNASFLANPYVLAAVAITSLAYGMYKLATQASATEVAQANINAEIERSKQLADEQKNTIDRLIGVVKDEVSTLTQKQTALEELKKLMPGIFKDYDVESLKLKDLIELRRELNGEIEKNLKLSNAQRLADNEAQIRAMEIQLSAEKVAQQASGGVQASSGTTETQKKLDILKAENVQLQKNFELEKKIQEQVKFENDAPAKKIEILRQQNLLYEEQLAKYGKSTGPLDPVNGIRDSINNSIKANTVLMNKYQAEVDKMSDRPLKTRLDIQTAIAEKQAEINILTEKSKIGISQEEEDRLTTYREDLANLKKQLENFTGEKLDKKVPVKTYDAEKVERDNLREIQDLTYENEMALLAIQEDSSEKSIAILKAEQERKFILLNRQKDDAIRAMQAERLIDKKENPNYNDEEWKARIEEYKKVWDETLVNQSAINSAHTSALLKSELEKWMTFEEKKQKLKDDSIKALADLDKLKAIDNSFETEKAKADYYAEKVAQIGRDLQSALIELDKINNKGVIGRLFSDVSEMSISDMRELIDEAEKFYQELPKTDENVQTLKAVRGQINNLKEAVYQTEIGFGRMAENIKKLLKGDYNPDDLLKIVGEIKAGFEQAKQYIGFFAESLQGLGEAFGSQSLQDIASGIEDAVSVIDKTIQGAELGAKIGGPIGAAIGGAIGLASSLGALLAKKHDAKNEREIQRIQKQVDALKKSYDALEKSIDKAYSVDATKLIQQQDENLKRQKKLLEQQIKAEKDKKKTDNDKIKQWQDAIDEINEQLASSQDRQIEAIIGTDVSNAIEQFANAYMEAWSAGEDKAKAMKDVVRNMVKNAIAELVKGRLSGEVEKFSKYLAEAMDDGILTALEIDTLNTLEQAINDKMRDLSNTLDAYVVDEQADPERQAQEKGFAQMSQDSADELNGRFATLQAHTFMITESIRALQMASAIQLKHLAGIETNTKSLSRLEKIESDIGSMKNTFNDIYDNGVIIRR